MSETDWEFNEDGSCTLSQYDNYEFKMDIVILTKENLAKFIEQAKGC